MSGWRNGDGWIKLKRVERFFFGEWAREREMKTEKKQHENNNDNKRWGEKPTEMYAPAPRQGQRQRQWKKWQQQLALKVHEMCKQRWEILPWSVDSASRETVNFHNSHMAQRWGRSAYYPPVISPCLRVENGRKSGLHEINVEKKNSNISQPNDTKKGIPRLVNGDLFFYIRLVHGHFHEWLRFGLAAWCLSLVEIRFDYIVLTVNIDQNNLNENRSYIVVQKYEEFELSFGLTSVIKFERNLIV